MTTQTAIAAALVAAGISSPKAETPKAPAKAKRAPAKAKAKAKAPAKLKPATPAKSAKAKTPTKAERARVNLAKANAKASNAAVAASDVNELIAKLVKKTEEQDGAVRTMSAWMNDSFKEAMRDYRCHWSHFSPANCRTDNEKHILGRVNDIKAAVRAAAEARGLVNLNKPWSDVVKTATTMWRGSAKREPNAVPLEKRQQLEATRLYKAGMKEDRPTQAECDFNEELGKLLVKYFKVDLAKLG